MIKTSDVLQFLPGGDCYGQGGCNCKSCEECAEKIINEKDPVLCPACNQEQVDSIANIIGVESVDASDNVAFIRCNSEIAPKERFANFDTCEGAKKKGFSTGECQYGCFHIGSCIENCNFNAMYIEDENIVINKDKCNGCGACAGNCPQSLIVMVPRDATVFIPCASKNDEDITRQLCGSGCIGCGECEDLCPEGAVHIVENCAVIDYDKCVGCMVCSVKCKKKIIIDEIHDISKHKDTVAFVRCSGGKNAYEKFTEMEIKDCRDAVQLRNECDEICKLGCVGLGNCTKVCRYDAIEVVDGTARVDESKCVGCLDCIDACPNTLIVPVPYKGTKMVACASTLGSEEKMKLCNSGCIACGDCQENCPDKVIKVIENCAVIDPEKCENCHACTYVCSKNVIKEIVVPEYNYLQREAISKERG